MKKFKMIINRNNYEEFFLLYVDNELSGQEKIAVDVFLAENPDLQEEMLMLQQSILVPDAPVFLDKTSLLKEVLVNDDTQEQLLLLLDNELDKTAKKKLLTQIEKNTAVQEEWNILKQTKLSAADKIIFEDKAILYKEDGGKVIAIKWWRLAAAVMLIGFGVWGVVNFSSNNGSIQQPVIETAKNNPSKSNTAPAITKEQQTTNNNPAELSTEKKVADENITAIEVKKETKEPVVPSLQSKKMVAPVAKQKAIAPEITSLDALAKQVEQPKTNNLPAPLRNINDNSSNKNNTAIVNSKNTKEEDALMKPEEKINDAPTYATLTSLPDGEGDGEEDNGKRKSKIGGFFKKLKRVVERKTSIKSTDEKTFRIANISFAMQ